MKRYFQIYLKCFLIVQLIFILLAFFIYRRTENSLPFMRLSLGAFIIAIFIALSIYIFKHDKGNGIINAILGYVTLIPAIFLIRFIFGQALFRFTWLFYLLFIFVGFIYGIALFIVSKKYKHLTNELNALLEKQNKDEE